MVGILYCKRGNAQGKKVPINQLNPQCPQRMGFMGVISSCFSGRGCYSALHIVLEFQEGVWKEFFEAGANQINEMEE
jgi:hypothetical protein